MHLSVSSAQQIVSEISTIVKQNVNLMDEKGYIIASTDAKRIGNFHEGAKKIIDNGLPEYYVSPEAETPMTRAGLNLPIRIDEETIGVIGITGEYGQVYNYGQIVKKVTEILVRESSAKDRERLDAKNRDRFVESWIFGGNMEHDPSLAEHGMHFHVDVTKRRRGMVLRIDEMQQLAGTAEGQKAIEKVEKHIRTFIQARPDNIYLRLATKQVCLVSPCSDDKIFAVSREMVRSVKSAFGVDLLVGVDNCPDGTTDANDAYLKANKASRACSFPSRSVMFYDQINMEIFLEEIPYALKKEYLRKIFARCTAEDVRKWMKILEAYFGAEGSITQTAVRLYMHKNTLQYKLKKLRECTGYDVRLPSNSAIFYMAILFYREVRSDPTVFDR